MSSTTIIAIGVAGLAVVVITVWHNVRGRRRERAIVNARGPQDVAAFVGMFTTDAERLVAQKLYPRLQSLTHTHELPLAKDDIFRTLDIDIEDLLDEVVAVFADLGCRKPTDSELSDGLAGVKTIGQLVSAIANLTTAAADSTGLSKA
jgi:hypothetical protein